jgi:DNA-binding transcriptional LysR family regulator
VELTDLRYFQAIAEELSFTAAADRLRIAQPSLSQRIARLEQELGGALFERTGRGIRLTSAGIEFLRRATLVLAEADAARTAFHSALHGASGSLSIGASSSLARSLLPSLLSEYTTLYAGVDLHVTERRTPELIRLMETGALDVALIYSPHPPTQMPMRVLMDVPLVAVTPASRVIDTSGAVDLGSFRDDRFILLAEPGESYYNFIVELCNMHAFTPSIVCTGVEVQTAYHLAKEGIGVAIVSRIGLAGAELEQPWVYELSDERAYTSVVLLSRDQTTTSIPAERFRECAIRQVAQFVDSKMIL